MTWRNVLGKARALLPRARSGAIANIAIGNLFLQLLDACLRNVGIVQPENHEIVQSGQMPYAVVVDSCVTQAKHLK